ncbi:MAG TPA: hypothetical protein VHC43_14400 [Mycobacteriales bacterium]|nr:hypothetical protein [Mycobacteriales bacterium]
MRLDWRDAGVRATAGLLVFVAAGFVVIGLAWSGTAARGYAVYQLPWLVSGGLVGLSLVGVGVGLLDVHLWRRQAAVRRAALGEVVRDTSELTEEIAARLIARREARTTASRAPAAGRAPRKSARPESAPRKATPRKQTPRKAAARKATPSR